MWIAGIVLQDLLNYTQVRWPLAGKTECNWVIGGKGWRVEESILELGANRRKVRDRRAWIQNIQETWHQHTEISLYKHTSKVISQEKKMEKKWESWGNVKIFSFEMLRAGEVYRGKNLHGRRLVSWMLGYWCAFCYLYDL